MYLLLFRKIIWKKVIVKKKKTKKNTVLVDKQVRTTVMCSDCFFHLFFLEFGTKLLVGPAKFLFLLLWRYC